MAKNPEFSRNPRSGVVNNMKRNMHSSKTNQMSNYKNIESLKAPHKNSFAIGHSKQNVRSI